MEKSPEKNAEDEARLDRLERAGLIRRGKSDMLKWLERHKPVRRFRGSLLKELLEERESGW